MHGLRIRILQVYGIFSVSCVVEMEISLDNPGFQLDVTDQVDVHQAVFLAHHQDHHPRGKLLAVPVSDVMAG